MPKKLGILTFHLGFNEGVILQAFCLSQHLSNHLSGWKVDIIDQRYKSKLKAYGPARNPKEKALNDFINNSLPLSEKCFIEANHKRVYKFIQNTYDALVVGSDEIWRLNDTYPGKWFSMFYKQRDLWNVPFLNAYWPDKKIKIPKIAYAACVGQTDWTKFPKRYYKKMKTILSDFALLSVRDKRTMSFLEYIDPNIARKAEFVPDPAFSVDIHSLIKKEAVKHKLEILGVDFSRPRVAVVSRNDLGNDANCMVELFKRKGFQTIALSIPKDSVDIDLSKQVFDPLEWVSIFGFIDVCISMLMHPCICCILNDTPFVAIDARAHSKDRESKIKDLMRSFGLMDFYYDPRGDSLQKLQQICVDGINRFWPYEQVKKTRKLFKNRSSEFASKINKILARR